MDIPAYGVILDLGESNTFNSILQSLLAYSKFTELVLFNTEYKNKPILRSLQKIYEKQIQHKCMVQPKTLHELLDNEMDELTTMDNQKEIIEQFIKILGSQFRLIANGKVRFGRNVAKYFSVLRSLIQAKNNCLPHRNIEFLQNEYTYLRNRNINEIIRTTSLCVWNKATEHQSSKIMDLFYGQFLTTYRCGGCTYNDYKFENFCVYDLQEYSGNNLDELLTKAREAVMVNDMNCKMCGGCEITKQKIIIKEPQCMIITLNPKKPMNISEELSMITFSTIIKEKPECSYNLFALTTHDVSAGYQSYTKRINQWHKYTTANGRYVGLSSVENIKNVKPTSMFFTLHP